MGHALALSEDRLSSIATGRESIAVHKTSSDSASAMNTPVPETARRLTIDQASTSRPRRRPWWWLIGAAVLVLMMLVPLSLMPPSNPYLYWFQTYVAGRTNEDRAMVITPQRGFTGRWTTYHFNLTVDSEMDIVEGKLQGVWRRYDQKTGNIWWVGEYAANVAVGTWRWYDASGALTSEAPGDGHTDPVVDFKFMVLWMEF